MARMPRRPLLTSAQKKELDRRLERLERTGTLDT
jgi:hypothetical protein